MAGNSKPRKKSTKVRTQNLPQQAVGLASKMIERESANHQASISSAMHGIMNDPNLSNEERERMLAELQEMKGQSITPLASNLTTRLMKKVNQ